MKILRFYDTIYRRCIAYWCGTQDEFIKRMRKYDSSYKSEECNGKFITIGNGASGMEVVWINSNLSKRNKYLTLVHELNHLTRYVLEDVVGMPLSFETQEAYAYYQEYLLQELTK